MKRNLVTRSLGSLLMLWQTKNEPTDAEWSECILKLDALLQAMKPGARDVKVLVHTDGGAPNEKQRGVLQKSLAKTPIRVAVVTDDMKARITSSTVALANRNQRSFATADLAQAYTYLGLSPDECRAAEAALKAMSLEVG
jgi:hypothetical protein